jgi:Icc-related predicted phosphoesterase
MKILAFSDTHGFHNQLTDLDFQGVDMAIFAGDESNQMNPSMNELEAVDFLKWYNNLNVKYKIFVAGNHSTAIEAGLINPKHYENIIYLDHESICIEGINIFGSPYTPQFGSWAYMRARGKLDPYWQKIPENTDILVVHGPPKGILDLSYNREGVLEYCGDKELYNHVLRVQPKHMIFGHIHNFQDCYNSGTKIIDGLRTIFHNVSCVTDRKYDLGLTSRGQTFIYDTES